MNRYVLLAALVALTIAQQQDPGVISGTTIYFSFTGGRELYSVSTERLRNQSPYAEILASGSTKFLGETGFKDGMETVSTIEFMLAMWRTTVSQATIRRVEFCRHSSEIRDSAGQILFQWNLMDIYTLQRISSGSAQPTRAA